MELATELYLSQVEIWPSEGRHILAHYDDSSIIVYQAYCPSIGKFAVQQGRLGGPDFSVSRMSWIKPNFLWMMYRSGWGTKEGQEMTLALRLRRGFFDHILEQAVPSSYDFQYPGDREAWAAALKESEVRLQWDPDHSPSGARLPRKAIQLGLRGRILTAFATSEIVEVIDLTAFVQSQRANAESEICALRTPTERIYVPSAAAIRTSTVTADGP
jgi:hypothetical protein